MCARAQRVSLKSAIPMLQCMAHWSPPASLDAAADAALLRFLATPPWL